DRIRHGFVLPVLAHGVVGLIVHPEDVAMPR
ncbi:MAG: hypothetical protein ACJAYU_000775, partial [Bradymonadia bacterium]